MKNKLRKAVGILVGLVSPLALNFMLAYGNAITPAIIVPLSFASASLVGLGAFIFEGFY